MNREYIIRMAREAGYPLAEYETGPYVPPLLETLLKHAVSAEREACAYRAGIALLGADRGLANRVDQAIRARGQA